jgi:hypothetical protein
MNIAVLRRPELIETIRIYPGTLDRAAVQVKYLNDDERKQVGELADQLMAEDKSLDRETAMRKAFGRVAVKGFSEIYDGAEAMEFTPENVEFLMLNAVDFRVAVLTTATTLQRAIVKN